MNRSQLLEITYPAWILGCLRHRLVYLPLMVTVLVEALAFPFRLLWLAGGQVCTEVVGVKHELAQAATKGPVSHRLRAFQGLVLLIMLVVLPLKGLWVGAVWTWVLMALRIQVAYGAGQHATMILAEAAERAQDAETPTPAAS